MQDNENYSINWLSALLLISIKVTVYTLAIMFPVIQYINMFNVAVEWLSILVTIHVK